MKESDFWKKIRENLKLDFIRRVENSCEPGWADVHYMNNGYGGWIELKQEDSFPGKIEFEPAQPIWLTNYWENGGYCYIFLYVKKDNQIYVWAGKDAKLLSVLGGTKEVPPLIQTTMNIVGWRQIYELFKVPIRPV